jgi:hypothetical protein
MYGLVGDVQGLHSVFVVMALASLAMVPLAGLYHLSVEKRRRLSPQSQG